MLDRIDTPTSDNSPQTENGVQRLRAMGFGELLDTTFSLYRSHFRTFLGIATGYLIAMVIGVSISFFDDSIGRDRRVVLWIVTIGIISCISVFVVSALVFASVQAYLDGKIKTGAVFRQAIRQFFRCLVGAIIFGLVISLLTFFLLLCFVGVFRSFVSSTVGSIILGLGGFVILFLAVSSFLTYWCFYISSIFVERLSAPDELRRSKELIRGRWWRINGVMLAILLLYFSVGFIFRMAVGILLTLTELAKITEFLDTAQWMAFFELPRNIAEFHPLTALMSVINLGIDAFTLPIWVIGCTLLYFNQRIRREGFDIEMMATRRGE